MSNELIEQFSKKYEKIETHISWVFLDDNFVYKIKKPVKFYFLDFQTLERRKFFCEEELRLNRRLSPEIYLGVVPISQNSSREFVIGGTEKHVEYAVKMKRIPEEHRMDKLLPKGLVSKENILELADKIYEFHSKVDKIGLNTANYTHVLEEMLYKNFELIKNTTPNKQKMLEPIKKYLTDFLHENFKTFINRQERGMVRDCHGDMHSRNIFLSGKPIFIDGIEFDTKFRFIDIIHELSFLAMDLDRYKRTDLSNTFVQRYTELSKDNEIPQMINFHKCNMASVRAKVSALTDVNSPDIETYLDLAKSYIK